MSRFIKSFGFALQGIKSCFVREANFKIHVIFIILVIDLGFFLSISNTEWMMIVVCIAAVLAAELINTAIEELCNIVCKENHPGIKLVKDMAAAAVLITAIGSAITGAIIFIPKIISLIHQ